MNSIITNYTYDNGVRPVHKTNSRFDNEHFYYYDGNGLMNGIYYRVDIYNTGNFASGRLNFTRDQSGLISTITQDLAMTVNYDPDLQISSIAHTLPQPFDESYTYDDNGNRLTSLSNSFIYDDLNKLTESTTHEYAYDADGNMTNERNKITGETKKYYWDSESRMIKYEHLASDISPVDTTALYKYDIYDRRIQKNVNDTITNFMWEGDNLSFELNATNQPIRKYFTEMGMDDYFAHLEYAEVTNWAYVLDASYRQGWYGYIKDQVGTIYKVWDHNARAIADSRTYDSFGNLVSQTGTTKTPLGLQGKYYDAESGLNYFYHRYYNPVIGRFTSEDPIGVNGGLNLQNFVNSNPINSTDPKGLITQYIGPGDIPNDIILPTQISLWDILVDTIMSYEGTVESGYYSCLTNCMFGGITAPAIAKFAEETLMIIAHGGGFTMIAGKWYKFKYPTWFKAGGKYLIKLVPDLVKKFSKLGKWISVLGWAEFDKELFKCIKDCTDCPKSH